MKSSSSSSNTPKVDLDKFVDDLPKSKFMEVLDICEWEGGCFIPLPIMKAAITFRTGFEARDDDVFLASFIKTGSTWLKALLFCIMQRQNHQTLDTDVLTTKNPHSLVPTIESVPYMEMAEAVYAYDASAPRLLHTHLPHVVLPDSIKNSACKIIYLARNPKDTIISSWHFYNSFMRQNQQPFPLENYIDCFCSGMFHPYGSFVEHVAEFWEESRKRPEKILFLKYEELKADPKRQVMKIAEFLERPFGDEAEADEIVRRCSLERLQNLEVNKSGFSYQYIPNSSFFRKGEVGDFKNYLTPEMEMKIDQTISLKLEGLGLYF